MTCHRTATSAGSAIPNIFGMPEARMITLLKAYRDKQLPNPIMQGIAFGFNDMDIELVAAYLARTKKP